MVPHLHHLICLIPTPVVMGKKRNCVEGIYRKNLQIWFGLVLSFVCLLFALATVARSPTVSNWTGRAGFVVRKESVSGIWVLALGGDRLFSVFSSGISLMGISTCQWTSQLARGKKGQDEWTLGGFVWGEKKSPNPSWIPRQRPGKGGCEGRWLSQPGLVSLQREAPKRQWLIKDQ